MIMIQMHRITQTATMLANIVIDNSNMSFWPVAGLDRVELVERNVEDLDVEESMPLIDGHVSYTPT